MALWTLFGLGNGKATTPWPKHGDTDGQDGVLGMPRYHPDLREADARRAPKSARRKR